jgi:hypothetical protein
VLQVVTWLADEKIVLGATVLFWTYTRLSRRTDLARPADQMLCCVALAGILPHLVKRLVDRKRPDRVVVHGRRHGIPRSGNAWNSRNSRIADPFVPFPYSRLAIDHSARSDQDHAAGTLPERCCGGLVLGAAIDKLVGRLFNFVRATLVAKL